MNAANPPSTFRIILGIVAALLYACARIFLLERRRAGSWREAKRQLFKKPKPWQLVLFCVLWGFILIAFAVALILYRR